jgi:hypothetical protein
MSRGRYDHGEVLSLHAAGPYHEPVAKRAGLRNLGLSSTTTMGGCLLPFFLGCDPG